MTNPTTEPCCAEYAALSRRGLLAGAVALAGGSTVIGSAVVRASAASATPARSVLVVLSLRGAADGLSLVVPHADPSTTRPVRSWRSPRTSCWSATACSACTPRSRHWSRSGSPAGSPPSTRPGCRHATAPTSPRWRSSRTPTPDRPSAWAG